MVAEGVESTPLWDELSALGCDVAQGYGIAVPMPHVELQDWMIGWSDVVSQQTATHQLATHDS